MKMQGFVTVLFSFWMKKFDIMLLYKLEIDTLLLVSGWKQAELKVELNTEEVRGGREVKLRMRAGEEG